MKRAFLIALMMCAATAADDSTTAPSTSPSAVAPDSEMEKMLQSGDSPGPRPQPSTAPAAENNLPVDSMPFSQSPAAPTTRADLPTQPTTNASPATHPATAPTDTAALPPDSTIGRMLQPTPPPAPAPIAPMQPDSELARMLQTSNSAQPLQSQPAPPPVDATSGMAAVTPKAPSILLRAEGFYIIGRLARLGKMDDGFRELVFDSDGLALRDPPMRILPNQLLGVMEDGNRISSDPMAFRVSGYITQYKNHNYILIDKAVQEPRR